MKKLIKKSVYFLVLGLFMFSLCGCDPDEKIDPEEVRQYAMMCDPETLREYAAMLEDVADELEAMEAEVENSEEDADAEDADTEDADEKDADAKEADAKDADTKGTDIKDTDEKAGKPVSLKTLIKEQYSKDTVIKYVTDDERYNINISYHIPSINDDSADAKAINKEIAEFFEESVNLVDSLLDKTAEDMTDEPEFIKIGYDTYQFGDFVSIVVYGSEDYDGVKQHNVFLYNTSTKKRITNEEMLEEVKLTKDELQTYARNTLGANVLSGIEDFLPVIEQYYSVDDPSCASAIGYIAEMYQVALSETKMFDDILVYVDNDGKPCIVGDFNLPLGYGTYRFNTKLDLDEEPDIYGKYIDITKKFHYAELERDSFILDDGNKYEFVIPDNLKTKEFNYDSVSLGFDEKDSSLFVVSLISGDKEDKYTGNLNLTGIGEKGLEFAYELNNLNGEAIKKDIKSGSFNLFVEFGFDKNGEISGQAAKIQALDGFDFTGANGKEVIFDLIGELNK